MTERYSEKYMDVTGESVRRRVLDLSVIATDIKWHRHQTWVVSAPFCAMGHINDPRYLLGDENSTEARRLSPRMANAEFSAAAVELRRDYRKQPALQVITLKNIRVAEKLFVDYGLK